MTRKVPTMRNRLALPLLAALLTGCVSNPAPSPTPAPAGTPSVDEIVASNIAARGGRERLKALRSIRESGVVTASGGRRAPVVREIQRPGLFRLEFSYQGTTSVFAHDGTTAWQVAPLQGQFDPMVVPPEADATSGSEQRDIEGPLVDWREKGHRVEFVGRETLAGGDAFKLKVSLRSGTVRWDFVDVASRQIVRSDVIRIVRGHPTEVESLFSDFREVGGIVFPHRLEVRAKNRPEVFRVTVEKVELDPVLDAGRFQLPK